MKITTQLVLLFIVTCLANGIYAQSAGQQVFKKHVCVIEGRGITAQDASLLKAQEDVMAKCKQSYAPSVCTKDKMKCEQVVADPQADLNNERIEELLRILKENQAQNWSSAIVESTKLLTTTATTIAIWYFCFTRCGQQN